MFLIESASAAASAECRQSRQREGAFEFHSTAKRQWPKSRYAGARQAVPTPPQADQRAEPPRPPLTPRSPREALAPQRVPAPARSRRVRHPLVIAGNAVFTLLVLLAVGCGTAVYFGKQRFDAPGPLAEDKVVNIPRGLGIRDISALLERDGVIDQPWVFMGGVLVMKARGGLKHGEYQFTKHASLADVVDTIIDGQVVQHSFTVAEGLTSEQIVARLLENNVLDGQIKDIPHEGTLLPETYQFTRGMTREQILQRMQREDQARAAGDVGASHARSAGEDAGATGHAGLDRREGDRAGRMSARGSLPSSSTGSRTRCGCNPTRPSFTAWSAARARSGARS